MQLTADMFMEIVESLRSDGLHNGMRELRKAPRVGVRGRTSIMIPDKTGTKSVPVNVRDLSAAGIGLLIPEPLLSKGEEFILLLSPGVQRSRSCMLCVVRRVAKLSENLYSIGASFIREMKDSDMPKQSGSITETAGTMMNGKSIVGRQSAAAARAAAVPAHKPTVLHAPAPTRVGPASLSQPLGDATLAGADDQVVGELEKRLKALNH